MKVEAVKYMVMAQDMDRAVRFWSGVVDLVVTTTSPNWSELAFGDATVALHGGGSGKLNMTGLGLQVADAEAACREVKAGGGSVVSSPEDRPGEPIILATVADT